MPGENRFLLSLRLSDDDHGGEIFFTPPAGKWLRPLRPLNRENNHPYKKFGGEGSGEGDPLQRVPTPALAKLF